MKKLLYSFTLTLSFLLLSFNTLANDLAERQIQLEANFATMNAAHDAEKPFLEDVLRRKNSQFRERLVTELSLIPDIKESQAIIKGQAQLLSDLLEYSNVDLQVLSRELTTNATDENNSLQLKFQRRISKMDTYYEQLFTTLQTAKQYDLDVTQLSTDFSTELNQRAEFLANAILYLDTQKQETEKRLSYVVESEKESISKTITRYNEQISVSVMSLEVAIGILESMNADVTDYKQLLLTITGDINADVLDFNVAIALFDKWVHAFKQWAFENAPSLFVKILLFLFILYFTHVLSRIVSSAVRRSTSHSKMDFSVLMQDFFVSIASKAVIFIGILFAASQIGIELAPLLTGFGVAGVIIGFALQDTLSNFASGLMILVYRPYDVGDMVKVAGIQGTVKNMSLVSTSIQTIDNQRLVIPNNKIWGDVINNITAEKIRRVDMIFGIGYSDDIDSARAIFNNILLSDSRVLKTPEHMVKLHTLNESSVDFVVRPWVKTEDYWDVYWDVTEKVKKELDNANISIPFPQRDVHIYKHDAGE